MLEDQVDMAIAIEVITGYCSTIWCKSWDKMLAALQIAGQKLPSGAGRAETSRGKMKLSDFRRS